MKNIILIFCLTLVAFALSACNPKTPEPPKNANKPIDVSKAPEGATPAHEKGSPTATVVIEEFADYQCPQCAATYPKMNEIYSKYSSQIKFIYRNYPLKIPAHDKAYQASVATEAAGIQGKFWEMQGLLFTNQNVWTKATDFNKVLEDYAKQLNLNYDQFTTDMAGLAAKSRVDADIKRGDALGVKSTPTIILNGRMLAFEEHENLASLIDAELAKTKSNSQAANTSNTNASNSAKPSNTNSSNASK
jgi:protein-disulfide isomerase